MTRVVLDGWNVGDPIGDASGFGRVYEATRGDEVAVVKFVQKLPGADRELLFGEDLAGATHIISVLETGEDGDDWVIIMPRAEMSLEAYLSTAGLTLTVDVALPILIDIAMALESLQGKVVHRDLKPANVLLFQDHWCLADFGISRYADASTDEATRKFAMTPPYAAPEQWRHQHASQTTDVYAFGIIAYRMLSGQLPFPGPRIEDFREQHLHGEVPALPAIHPALAGLIHECMYRAPEARPTAANIVRRLRGIPPETPSPGIQRLQAANLAETERRGEQARRNSAEQSATEKRAALEQAANYSLRAIISSLRETILLAAPAATLRGSDGGWSISLGEATLSYAGVTRTPANAWGAWHDEVADLDVIAHTYLKLEFPLTLIGWDGRSHSLWFCNHAIRAEFGWFEGAFMNAAMLAKPQPRTVPYALPPSEMAAKALSRVISEFQVAWPFSALQVGELDEFVDRWAGWFGDAAAGRLQYPDRLPER